MKTDIRDRETEREGKMKEEEKNTNMKKVYISLLTLKHFIV